MEQMSQELAQKKALVDQVEGSKAWKVYRAIKGFSYGKYTLECR